LKKKAYRNVLIKTDFLSYEEYAQLLSSSDIGISLHKSSSDLDISMKILDMFGSGIPALSWKYQCLDELLQDGVNGRLFEISDDLVNL
jgi:beta-1,4-mannosyltransferase